MGVCIASSYQYLGGIERVRWLGYGPRARSLPHLLHSHRLVLNSDSRPDSLSCCRVPLPCSGSPYARRLRTSPHYYSTTTVLLALSVHSRAHRTAPRDLGPLITDPLRSPLPSRLTANELLRVTRGTLPCAQPPHTSPKPPRRK